MLLGKLSFLHTLFLENEERPSQKRFRAMFLRYSEAYMLFLNTFKMPEKSRGRSCTWPFNYVILIQLEMLHAWLPGYMSL